MQVAIDIRRISDFGVGTYIRNIVRALSRLDRENKYYLIGAPEKVQEIGLRLNDSDFWNSLGVIIIYKATRVIYWYCGSPSCKLYRLRPI